MAEPMDLGSVTAPKDWTVEEVRGWLCTCAAGRYARFAHRFGAVDGKRLSRMSVALMTNLVGEEELARKLFNELRNEMERIGALRQQQVANVREARIYTKRAAHSDRQRDSPAAGADGPPSPRQPFTQRQQHANAAAALEWATRRREAMDRASALREERIRRIREERAAANRRGFTPRAADGHGDGGDGDVGDGRGGGDDEGEEGETGDEAEEDAERGVRDVEAYADAVMRAEPRGARTAVAATLLDSGAHSTEGSADGSVGWPDDGGPDVDMPSAEAASGAGVFHERHSARAARQLQRQPIVRVPDDMRPAGAPATRAGAVETPLPPLPPTSTFGNSFTPPSAAHDGAPPHTPAEREIGRRRAASITPAPGATPSSTAKVRLGPQRRAASASRARTPGSGSGTASGGAHALSRAEAGLDLAIVGRTAGAPASPPPTPPAQPGGRARGGPLPPLPSLAAAAAPQLPPAGGAGAELVGWTPGSRGASRGASRRPSGGGVSGGGVSGGRADTAECVQPLPAPAQPLPPTRLASGANGAAQPQPPQPQQQQQPQQQRCAWPGAHGSGSESTGCAAPPVGMLPAARRTPEGARLAPGGATPRGDAHDGADGARDAADASGGEPSPPDARTPAPRHAAGGSGPPALDAQQQLLGKRQSQPPSLHAMGTPDGRVQPPDAPECALGADGSAVGARAPLPAARPATAATAHTAAAGVRGGLRRRPTAAVDGAAALAAFRRQAAEDDGGGVGGGGGGGGRADGAADGGCADDAGAANGGRRRVRRRWFPVGSEAESARPQRTAVVAAAASAVAAAARAHGVVGCAARAGGADGADGGGGDDDADGSTLKPSDEHTALEAVHAARPPPLPAGFGDAGAAQPAAAAAQLRPPAAADGGPRRPPPSQLASRPPPSLLANELANELPTPPSAVSGWEGDAPPPVALASPASLSAALRSLDFRPHPKGARTRHAPRPPEREARAARREPSGGDGEMCAHSAGVNGADGADGRALRSHTAASGAAQPQPQPQPAAPARAGAGADGEAAEEPAAAPSGRVPSPRAARAGRPSQPAAPARALSARELRAAAAPPAAPLATPAQPRSRVAPLAPAAEPAGVGCAGSASVEAESPAPLLPGAVGGAGGRVGGGGGGGGAANDGGKATRQMFDKRTLRRDNAPSFRVAISTWRADAAARARAAGDGAEGADPTADAPPDWLRVYVRKRPLFEGEVSAGEFDVVTAHGAADSASSAAAGRRAACSRLSVHVCLHRSDLKRMFVKTVTFAPTAAFGDKASSEEVYEHAASALVRRALDGGVGTLFSFGQTGSGKTHTCSAIERLAAAHIFHALGARVRGGGDGDGESDGVRVCFVELSGRRVGDLLAHDASNSADVSLRDDGQGNVALIGATRRPVRSAAELIAAINLGKSRRATEETAANATSSRSHAVLLIEIGSSSAVESGAAAGRAGRADHARAAPPSPGKLVLVDCAGTERKEDSAHHTAERRREGAEINASLHALKECLRAIAAAEAAATSAAAAGERAPRATHVPYRASTLTRVLSDSFTHPHSLVSVLATVSPGCTATEHTLHTLHTVTAMCALDARTREESVDVEAAPLFAPPPVPPKEWTHDALAEWMAAVKGGRFRAQALAMPTELDGKRLCRMPANYFTQVLCGGNDALGAALYAELHGEMDAASRLKHEHVKLMRNARSAAKLSH